MSLEDETRRLHETFGSLGYQVQEFLIPMNRPMEKMRIKLKQFCRLAADDTLLIVYYHGHGSLDDDNELVFSRYVPPLSFRLARYTNVLSSTSGKQGHWNMQLTILAVTNTLPTQTGPRPRPQSSTQPCSAATRVSTAGEPRIITSF